MATRSRYCVDTTTHVSARHVHQRAAVATAGGEEGGTPGPGGRGRVEDEDPRAGPGRAPAAALRPAADHEDEPARGHGAAPASEAVWRLGGEEGPGRGAGAEHLHLGAGVTRRAAAASEHVHSVPVARRGRVRGVGQQRRGGGPALAAGGGRAGVAEAGGWRGWGGRAPAHQHAAPAAARSATAAPGQHSPDHGGRHAREGAGQRRLASAADPPVLQTDETLHRGLGLAAQQPGQRGPGQRVSGLGRRRLGGHVGVTVYFYCVK